MFLGVRGTLGAFVGDLGGILGGSWGGLGGILRCPGPSWASLEPSGGHLGPSRDPQGTEKVEYVEK